MGARQRWVYRTDESGVCRAIPAGVVPMRYGETLDVLEDRVTRDLYAMECQEGSRFSGIGEYSKNILKKVWIDNRERDAEFDRRREQALRTQRERLGYD